MCMPVEPKRTVRISRGRRETERKRERTKEDDEGDSEVSYAARKKERMRRKLREGDEEKGSIAAARRRAEKGKIEKR